MVVAASPSDDAGVVADVVDAESSNVQVLVICYGGAYVVVVIIK